MSIPRPTRGMLVELHGGHKDGQRIPFQGPRVIVPRPPPAIVASPTWAAEQRKGPGQDTYTLRQSQPDGHWFYVLAGDADA